jgi:hypothetical protein
MTIRISLKPEIQQALERQAVASGTDVSSYVARLVQEQIAGEEGAVRRTGDDWSREFQAWLATHQSRNPHFDDSRESIYD